MGDRTVRVPSDLVARNVGARGAAGRAWASSLPALVAETAEVWLLQIEGSFADLSYNYVARVRRDDGSPAVLKLCFPDRELETEIAALRLFDGRGAARLLAVDVERGALLLERVEPGTPLSRLEDDAAATSVATALMRRIWRPVPSTHAFPSVDDWIDRALSRAPALLARRGEPRPIWFGRMAAIAGELRVGAPASIVLHGDLHHFNVLLSDERGWLAIDPKGVIGEPADEIGPWLLNRLATGAGDTAARRGLARTLDQLVADLALDPVRLRAAAFVRVALAALWSLEEGAPVGPWLRCVELLGEMVR